MKGSQRGRIAERRRRGEEVTTVSGDMQLEPLYMQDSVSPLYMMSDNVDMYSHKHTFKTHTHTHIHFLGFFV